MTIRINTIGGKSPTTLCIFKHCRVLISFTVSLMCLCATCLSDASVYHWLNQCQVLCSLPTHYATRVALHTGTVLCLPDLTET